MLRKCVCAIYVHLQLDLLKFYLVILKCDLLFYSSSSTVGTYFYFLQWILTTGKIKKPPGRIACWSNTERGPDWLQAGWENICSHCGSKAKGGVFSARLTYILPDCYSPQLERRKKKKHVQKAECKNKNKISLKRSKKAFHFIVSIVEHEAPVFCTLKKRSPSFNDCLQDNRFFSQVGQEAPGKSTNSRPFKEKLNATTAIFLLTHTSFRKYSYSLRC